MNVKSADNKFYRLRDLDTERAQDNAIKSQSTYNYIKIYDNQFEKFIDGIEEIKNNTENNIQKRVIIESFETTNDNLKILLG